MPHLAQQLEVTRLLILPFHCAPHLREKYLAENDELNFITASYFESSFLLYFSQSMQFKHPPTDTHLSAYSGRSWCQSSEAVPLSRHHDTSPMTGEVLPPPPGQDGSGVDKTLRPNHILRGQIIEYRERLARG